MAKPMSILELKGAIVENLNGLDEAQLSMLLQIVEDLTPQPPAGSHWDDPEFIVEMDRRVADYSVNPEQMRTSEEVQKSVLTRLMEFKTKNIT